MLASTDFVSSSWREVDRLLLSFRREYNATQPKAMQVADDDVTLLIAMDGAAAHKLHHPSFQVSHYLDFAEKCRQLMRARDGKVAPAELCQPLDCVACGWFPNDGQTAACSALAIRQHFVHFALDHSDDWRHERHALSAIGRTEFAAFRLLQMAVRDQCLVDPEIWQRLSPEVQDAMQSGCVGPPDFSSRGSSVESYVAENVESARRVVLQLTATAQQAAKQEKQEKAEKAPST